MKTGAVLVAVIGLSMMSQGFALGGWNVSRAGNSASVSLTTPEEAAEPLPALRSAEPEPAFVQTPTTASAPDISDGVQHVQSTLTPARYPTITVKKGIPVRWELTVPEGSLTGCNYRMLFQEFGFMYTLGYGTNLIEFTPGRSGSIPYTCWMGMIRGTIRVED